MARTKGKDGILLVATNPVAQMRNWAIDEQSDTAEGTTMGMDDKEFESTQQSWTASADCLLDASDTDGQKALIVGAELQAEFHPSGTGVGLPARSGTVIVTGANETAAHDGFVEVSFTFQGTGPLDRTDQTV